MSRLLVTLSISQNVSKPVRPDDDEEVDLKAHPADVDNSIANHAGDKKLEDLEHHAHHADDGHNDPRHHQAWLFLRRIFRCDFHVCPTSLLT